MPSYLCSFGILLSTLMSCLHLKIQWSWTGSDKEKSPSETVWFCMWPHTVVALKQIRLRCFLCDVIAIPKWWPGSSLCLSHMCFRNWALSLLRLQPDPSSQSLLSWRAPQLPCCHLLSVCLSIHSSLLTRVSRLQTRDLWTPSRLFNSCFFLCYLQLFPSIFFNQLNPSHFHLLCIPHSDPHSYFLLRVCIFSFFLLS